MPSVTSSCRTNDDCIGSRLCMGSICVGTGLASTDPDSSKSLDGVASDGGVTEPVTQCPAQCTQDSECFVNGCGDKTQCNKGTCQFPQRCPASCASSDDCSGCTGKTSCVGGRCSDGKPECSGDQDCKGQNICENQKCIEGCRNSNQCRGEDKACRNNKCVQTCEESEDCKSKQRCRNGVCQ